MLKSKKVFTFAVRLIRDELFIVLGLFKDTTALKIGLLKFFICFNVRFKFTSKIYLLKLFSEDLADSNFFNALIHVFCHKSFHKLPGALKPLDSFCFAHMCF